MKVGVQNGTPGCNPVNPKGCRQDASCPQSPLLFAAAQNLAASAARLANPAIQRLAAQRQQIHESSDEGSHEDDAGSEVL